MQHVMYIVINLCNVSVGFDLLRKKQVFILFCTQHQSVKINVKSIILASECQYHPLGIHCFEIVSLVQDYSAWGKIHTV